MQANNAAAVGSLSPGGRLSLAIGTGMNPNVPMVDVLDITHSLPKQKLGRIYTLDAETGKLGWTFEPPIWKNNSAVAAGDTVFHTCLPDSFSNAAIGGDGTVYLGFMDGRLYAVRDKDGDGVIDPKSEASTYNFKN